MSSFTLGDRLLHLRNTRNMTQAQVARKLQVTPQAYSQYERNLRRPPYEILEQLASYYHINLDYLLTGQTAGPALSSFLVAEYNSLPQEAKTELDNYLQYFRHKYNLKA